MKNIMNSILRKFCGEIKYGVCKEELSQSMFDITDLVNQNLLGQFNYDLKILTNGEKYAFKIGDKIVFWGNVDFENPIATIDTDMLMYYSMIVDSIESNINPNYRTDYIGICKDIINGIRHSNIIVRIMGDKSSKIYFLPTKK